MGVCIEQFHIFTVSHTHMSKYQKYIWKVCRSQAGHCQKSVFILIRGHLIGLQSAENLSSTKICDRWSLGVEVYLHIALLLAASEYSLPLIHLSFMGMALSRSDVLTSCSINIVYYPPLYPSMEYIDCHKLCYSFFFIANFPPKTTIKSQWKHHFKISVCFGCEPQELFHL